MGNKRLSAVVPALALLVVVTLTGPAFAQVAQEITINGAVARSVDTQPSTPQPEGPVGLVVNDGWSSTTVVPPAFFWSGTPPVFADDGSSSIACGDATCEFTFTLANAGCVSATDDFIPGDQFRLYDNTVEMGVTPVVPVGGPDVDNGPDVAYFDPAYSSATFVVPAGSHSITVEVIGASFSGGRGYIRADTLGSFAPCDALLPDLVVDSLTHFPANPDTEDTIQFTAVVKNIGAAAAGSSTLSFKIGGESPTDPNALFEIGPLASGASETVIRNVGLSVAQNYLNTAVADFNDDVAESNEANNTTTDSYTVTQAEEPSGVVYSIVTAPINGDLYEEIDMSGDPVGSPLGAGDPIADPESLHYFPDPGFEGTDMFTYRCTDTATGLFDDATVDIIVSSAGGGDDLTIDFDEAGTGMGDVAIDVGGSIVAVCSTDCTVSLSAGDIVKLQARPVALGIDMFTGWTGPPCSGSSQIFTFTKASGPETCGARFDQ